MADVGLGRLTSTDIASTTRACRWMLEQCLSIRSLSNDGWAENRLADFNVWDSGLGASSSRRASLEDRLATKTHVRTTVLNLLMVFHNAIGVVKDLGLLHDQRERSKTNGGQIQVTTPQLGSQAAQSHDIDEELTVDDLTLPESIETADVILNDLARLAALIRKAGTTSRLSRADATFDPRMQKHEKLREHLYRVLLCQPSILEDRRHAYWDSIEPSLAEIPIEKRSDYWNRVDQESVDLSYFSHRVTEIQERLVVANLRRSHRFAYSQRHGSKLEYSSRQFEATLDIYGQAQTKSSAAPPTWTSDMPFDPERGRRNEPARMYTDHMGTPNSGAENVTDTVASEVETVIMKDFAKPPTPSQQAVTEISTTGSRLRYPKPPLCELELTLFTCPCCCVPLPKIFASSQRWRKHLKEDILPYTCVLPKCPKPASLFSEKSTWLDHMFNDHVGSVSWVCDICGDRETYTTQPEFIGHLLIAHPGAIADDQVILFAEMCYKKTGEQISSCPLCSWAEDVEGYVTNEQVLDHVAEHVHDFSLRSLPWAPDQIVENPKTFAYACAKVEQWWITRFPNEEGSGYVPALPKIQHDLDSDPYFFTHEYFAESSGPSSLAAVSSGDRTLSDCSGRASETSQEGMSNLCAVCHQMLINWKEYEMDEDHIFPHHKSLSDMQIASKVGCALCYQFCRGFMGDLPTPTTRMCGHVSVQTFNSTPPGGMAPEKAFNLSLVFSHTLTDSQSENLPDIDYSTVKMLPSKDKSYAFPSTNTRDTLDLAAKWSLECLTSHPECMQQIDVNSMPSRLIDISRNELRVCDSKDLPKGSQYATLTHCWGSTTPYGLTTSSSTQLYHGILPVMTSQTLKDAVEIATHSRLLYLWVDYLCIIQDSQEDWMREGPRIAAIFGGSSLNISATSARDGSEGCFFDRPEHFVCQAHVDTRDSASSHKFVSDNYVSEILRNEPLMSRAWALQERLLPPRNLHFTKTEVYWECNHYSASETFPDGIPRALAKPFTFEKKPLDQTMWSWIVTDYTKRRLAMALDKALAISGIVQTICTKSKDTYVAGMWETDLAIQLCWFIDDSSLVDHRRTPCYVAPTWSWLSTTGMVTYPRSDPSYRTGREELWVFQLEHNVRPLSSDEFGAIKSGTLFLTCIFLLPVELESGAVLFTKTKEKLGCAIYLDTPSEHQHDIHALPILSHQDGSLIKGLLLSPVDGRPSTYQRLGLFMRSGHDAVRKFSEAASIPLIQAFESSTRPEDDDFLRIELI